MKDELRLVWLQDFRSMETIVRIVEGEKWVEDRIPDEVLVELHREARRDFIEEFLVGLTWKWRKKYDGIRLVVHAPVGEGLPWTISYDNVIDGEFVVERKAIGNVEDQSLRDKS